MLELLSVFGLCDYSVNMASYTKPMTKPLLAEDTLDYALALNSAEKHFEVICWLRIFMGSFAEKKSDI